MSSDNISRPRKDYAPTSAFYVAQFVQDVMATVSPLTTPSADAFGRAGSREATRDNPHVLSLGIIRFAVPHLNSYAVLLLSDSDPARQRIVMAKASVTGTLDQGVCHHAAYASGQTVVVRVDPTDGGSIIMGAVPTLTGDLATQFCDLIGPGEPVGVGTSPQYVDFMSAVADRGGVIPAPTDAPPDSLPGDYTLTSVTGNMLHIDDAMLQFRASEICGLFCFTEDGHTRLSGESLRIESPAMQIEHGTSVSEISLSAAYCIYPWEAMGAVGSGQSGIVDRYSGEDSDFLAAGRMYLEPTSPDQLPVSRIDEIGGYLGQGICRTVSSPSAGGLNTATNPVAKVGLSRQQTLIDGSILIESVKQVFIAKTAVIPVFAIEGSLDEIDVEETPYRFNGQGEAGDPHIVSQLSSQIPVAAGLAADEMYAYLSGWLSLHAGVYHPKVTVRYTGPAFVAPEEVQTLDQADWITPAGIAKAQVDVDHRLRDVDVYKILSFFTITESGDLVLQNGLGPSIRITSGGIFIDAGTVHVQAAKTISMTGRTVSVRGYRQVEVASSRGRVLVKAETDLNMLGGNSGVGGVLLESRSRQHLSDWADKPEDSVGSGVMIKGLTSHVTLLGGDVLAKTGPGESGATAGQIILDCGGESIVQRCTTHVRQGNEMIDYLALPSPEDTEPAPLNHTSVNGLTLHGDLRVSLAAIVGGTVEASRGFATQTGQYKSGIGQQFIAPGSSSVDAQIAAADEYRTQLGISRLQRWVDTHSRVLSENRPLHPIVVSTARFGFPSSHVYGTKKTTLPQPTWHRSLSGQLERWQEPVVAYRTEAMQNSYEITGQRSTRPWPGHETWERADSMLKVGNSEAMFNMATQTPLSPSGEAAKSRYEAAEIRDLEATSLASGAMVLRPSVNDNE